jgi:hypothetical protein
VVGRSRPRMRVQVRAGERGGGPRRPASTAAGRARARPRAAAAVTPKPGRGLAQPAGGTPAAGAAPKSRRAAPIVATARRPPSLHTLPPSSATQGAASVSMLGAMGSRGPREGVRGEAGRRQASALHTEQGAEGADRWTPPHERGDRLRGSS